MFIILIIIMSLMFMSVSNIFLASLNVMNKQLKATYAIFLYCLNMCVSPYSLQFLKEKNIQRKYLHKKICNTNNMNNIKDKHIIVNDDISFQSVSQAQ